ncbi:hypothetical protein ACQEWB_22835 [Streptomyces sp. CA-249302]|uniref:hypothetical protein n=1 Tax=Streptomyces sp. CA-249302 TaxID=3240058 RepID=UPI003D8A1B2C
MTADARRLPNAPQPHQLVQVLPTSSLPPPLFPPPPPPAATRTTPRPSRRRRLRPPRFLTDGAFWSGVLTALSVAGLVAAIVATA